ncbi:MULTISPECIES: amino acid ABC transporter permease [unclassified Agarivorans]|uniref:amino acid ABC transporter permease n=1 Tax=unclassified Agarivorans TaxID=2636026 RepID=UPI0026E2C0D0|nr:MULTISPECIES: amino acid ABC transporter permease [unclassified Agarivorans]MDO6685914.1 amino acid ABC transporter permease [Agarivorans sp. 3_MG-2023]MDO6713948.1 amino acid ABC transporter permease [Agarivorans sp. 2_MG-2023]
MAAHPSSKDNSANSLRKIWFDPNVRALVFQILVVIGVIGFFFYIISNALYNLEQRGITTGFGFMNQTAGFGIIQSLVEYDESHTFGRTFLVGLLNTILISVLGIIFATILGFIMGIARLSQNWLVSKVATVYIETLRNIPLLLQIFFWYFAVLRALPSPKQSLSIGEAVFLNVRGLYMPGPIMESGANIVVISFILAIIGSFVLAKWAKKRQMLTGQPFPIFSVSAAMIILVPTVVFFLMGSPIGLEYPALKGFNFRGGMVIIPELAALLVALTFYTAAFIAEIVRSGILAVSKGQSEAAESLGLTRTQALKLVIIPQAMRVIIPPLTSQYLNLTKNSSLATAIGYPDLVSVFMGTTLNQTGQAIEVIALTMAVYLTISIATSILMNIYNKKMALVER